MLPGDVALFGSPARWELLQQAIREGRTWYYGDHGYFGRGEYFRVTRNAYQHTGVGPGDMARFAKFRRPIQPWRRYGQHIVITLQTPRYYELFGTTQQAWLDGVRQTIQQHTKRPLVIRSKQEARVRPIELDLRGAWALVTFSSATALDALIAGIPVFVLADFAAGYRWGTPDLHQITKPVTPDGREALMSCLAANQWTFAELERGVAWRALQESGHEGAAGVSGVGPPGG